MTDSQVIARMRRYERQDKLRATDWDRYHEGLEEGTCDVCGGLGWIAEDVPCDCLDGRDVR